MEVLVIIVAFWLVLFGAYGAWPLVRGIGPRSVATRLPDVDLTRRYNEQIAAAAAALAQPQVQHAEARQSPQSPFQSFESRPSVQAFEVHSTPQPVESRRPARASTGGLFSEVDMLRAQVEQLRSEVAALSSGSAPRLERPRLRRYRTGVYTYLPRLLRQQVRDVRVSRRAAIHI
jgi:hypothetical protein